MKIEDFELEIIKAKPGETVIIKFPIEKYCVDEIHNWFKNLKGVLPEGVELIMMPIDWTVEIEK